MTECEETCTRIDCRERGCIGGSSFTGFPAGQLHVFVGRSGARDSEIDERVGTQEVLDEARKMIAEYEDRAAQVRGYISRSTFWPNQQEWALEASRLTERVAALRELCARFE